MRVGNNQNVRRRARMQILERGHVFVLINYFSGQFTRDDFAK
jgi:hypothetical protein